MKKHTRITLNGLMLPVSLGWPTDERINKQMIWLDITLHFPSEPLGCITDLLDDTICYDALTQHIQEKIADKHFRLIEFLAKELYQIIKNYLPNISIDICVTKKPNIKGLTNGVSFYYGDVCE